MNLDYLNKSHLEILIGLVRIDFFKSFTPHEYNVNETLISVIKTLSIRELVVLALVFLWGVLFSKHYAKSTSVKKFMDTHNFSTESQALIDRMCRLSDGGGADRYTLFQLLEVVNQHLFYDIYQPIVPNDIGIFKIWKKQCPLTMSSE